MRNENFSDNPSRRRRQNARQTASWLTRHYRNPAPCPGFHRAPFIRSRAAPVNTTLEFTLLIAAGSFLAGLLGSLTGLGGGVIIVPLLTLAFAVNIRYAIGASLVSVIATSSGAAAAFLKEGFSNIRVGMFLEVATTIGALCGAFLATRIPTAAIAIIFGLVLLYSAWTSAKPETEPPPGETPDRFATYLKMDGSYPTDQGIREYHVRHVPAGFSLMYVAGALPGLPGIG